MDKYTFRKAVSPKLTEAEVHEATIEIIAEQVGNYLDASERIVRHAADITRDMQRLTDSIANGHAVNTLMMSSSSYTNLTLALAKREAASDAVVHLAYAVAQATDRESLRHLITTTAFATEDNA